MIPPNKSLDENTRAPRGAGDGSPRRAKRSIWVGAGFVVLAVCGLGVLLFRPTPPAPAPAELSRDQLQFTNGLTYRRGDTNPFTGLMTESYPQGGLRSRSAISNGLLHGISRGWHTNGQLQVEEHFVAGVSHGPRTRWYADGTKESEARILHGALEGIFRKWHTNGALAQEITLSNGVPHGPSRAFQPDGTIKTEVRLRDGVVVRESAGL